jgi:hypothetical protein
MLVGTITLRHVVRHSRIIIKGSGWRVWLKAIKFAFSLRKHTFLECI